MQSLLPENWKKKESLYNQFKARQAFDFIDRTMDEMKGSLSIAKT